jgi:DNA replication protein DnaC
MSWARHTSTLALDLAACQRDHRVRFTAATALVSQLTEARDDRHL